MSPFLREGLVLTGAGLSLGLIRAFAVTRLMAALLIGVTPTDTLTFAAVAVLIGLVASECPVLDRTVHE